jgi:hypothetical protein
MRRRRRRRMFSSAQIHERTCEPVQGARALVTATAVPRSGRETGRARWPEPFQVIERYHVADFLGGNIAWAYAYLGFRLEGLTESQLRARVLKMSEELHDRAR